MSNTEQNIRLIVEFSKLTEQEKEKVLNYIETMKDEEYEKWQKQKTSQQMQVK
jgi:hypothetical protein